MKNTAGDMIKIRRALVSVADKRGLDNLVPCLVRHGVEIIATGGTARTVRELGFEVTEVAAVTGVAEAMAGRFKTLHPAIIAAILHDRDEPGQEQELAALGGTSIDLVIVNFYPFQAHSAGVKSMAELVELIDIGGPTMVRSAAKNHRHVVVAVDHEDYLGLIQELDDNAGTVSRVTAAQLAAKAFMHTASYDAVIAKRLVSDSQLAKPNSMTVRTFTHGRKLRYGENPHQQAQAYIGRAELGQLSGEELSYNNIHDATQAWRAVAEHSRPACAIVKHAVPCGVAVADNLAQAFTNALASDPVSAYGGVVACNRQLDLPTLKLIRKVFFEVLVCESYNEEAKQALSLLQRLKAITGPLGVDDNEDGKLLGGIALLQERDTRTISTTDLHQVTARVATAFEMEQLLFAWRVVKHTKSNAIVIANNYMTLGVGAGQTSRVEAAAIAISRAQTKGHTTVAAVAAADGFFPFPDGLETLTKAGISAVIQPGGSKRDPEVIAAADAAGIAMVVTGVRHFSH